MVVVCIETIGKSLSNLRDTSSYQQFFYCLEITAREVSEVLASKFQNCEMGHGDCIAGRCYQRREAKDR